MQLQDRCGLVTGAASGLGHATVKALHAAGAMIVGIDLPGQDTRALIDLGERVVFVEADVCDPDGVARAVATAVEEFGGVHVAVNCAGVGTPGRVLSRQGPLELAQFRRVVEINLVGTFNVLSLAAQAMVANDEVDGERGVIVNTASIAAWDGQVGQAAYAASKAGIVGLTLPVARDLARHSIRCVGIAPGVFATPMVQGLDVDVIDALEAEVPNPSRLGNPDEFALLVKQVIANPYLNGEVIRLDGALRMR